MFMCPEFCSRHRTIYLHTYALFAHWGKIKVKLNVFKKADTFYNVNKRNENGERKI